MQQINSPTRDRQNESNLPQVMQPLSPDLQRKTMLVRQKYGSRENFLVKLNPEAQILAGRHPDRAFFGDAPSLAVMKKTYGENMPTMWLMPQILDLVVYSNSKGTLNENQARFLAEIIAQEYFFLKASELLLFFYRFKLGRYGHFYGVVDPMRITEALDEFVKERNYEIAKKEKEEEEAEAARKALEDPPVKPADWCKMQGMPQFDDVLSASRYVWQCEEVVNAILQLFDVLTLICQSLAKQKVK